MKPKKCWVYAITSPVNLASGLHSESARTTNAVMAHDEVPCRDSWKIIVNICPATYVVLLSSRVQTDCSRGPTTIGALSKT